VFSPFLFGFFIALPFFSSPFLLCFSILQFISSLPQLAWD
jgi:hypothetical protein